MMMHWICYKDIDNKNDESILEVNSDCYCIMPCIGATIISKGVKYEVVDFCIDYDKTCINVYVEKIADVKGE